MHIYESPQTKTLITQISSPPNRGIDTAKEYLIVDLGNLGVYMQIGLVVHKKGVQETKILNLLICAAPPENTARRGTNIMERMR